MLTLGVKLSKPNPHFLSLACAMLVGAWFLGLLAMYALFMRESKTSHKIDAVPSVAVVFTGQYSCLEAALGLLREKKIDRIIISGVNGGAGMTPTTFPYLFKLSESETNLLGSQIILLTQANNTYENALEIREFFNTSAPSSLLLITSQDHLPRAKAYLVSALPNTEIQTLGVARPCCTRDLHWNEFFKFVVTWIYIRYQEMAFRTQQR